MLVIQVVAAACTALCGLAHVSAAAVEAVAHLMESCVRVLKQKYDELQSGQVEAQAQQSAITLISRYALFPAW